MRLTVLVDNNTLIDRYLLAEPGLSLLVEDAGTTVLFDVGYSDVFLRNAQKLGLSLSSLDYVVLSHGHIDHTWGLGPLIRHFTELDFEKRPRAVPALVTHPQTFVSVTGGGVAESGALLSEQKLAKHFRLLLSDRPVALGPRLTYLGEVPRRTPFEARQTFGRKEGAAADDIVIEDSALVYRSGAGLVIMTGCSHAGICNIIEHAKEVCGDSRVADVIGGLHLQSPSAEQLAGTLAYFERLQPLAVRACHCTDLRSKIALSTVVDIREVGAGTVVTYD